MLRISKWLLVMATSLIASSVFAQTQIEAQQRHLVTRYYQLIRGMELSCTKGDLTRQADYYKLLQRWRQTQADLSEVLTNSPHYSAVVQSQEPRLQANAQKNNAAYQAEVCDYYAQLMTAMLDTDAGKQAVQEDIKALKAQP